jgi:hypothetical protein
MGRVWSTHRGNMNAYRILVGKTEGKRPLGKPRRRWKDDIKLKLREIGCAVIIRFIWLRIGTNHRFL